MLTLSLGGVAGGTMMRPSALCPSAVWLSALWPSAVSCGSLLVLGLHWCSSRRGHRTLLRCKANLFSQWCVRWHDDAVLGVVSLGSVALGDVALGGLVWLFVGSQWWCVPWRPAVVCSVQWGVHRGGGAACQSSFSLFVELELLC